MPIYDYRCDTCGDFEAWGKMSASSAPAQCTICGANSGRIITAPSLAILGSNQRIAHERNEKSAHEPKTTRRSSCSCSGAHTCSGKTSNPSAKEKKAMAKTGGLEMQTKKTARPWMLGH
ncbi:MAG: zinc ribbon domain-containing protein [Gallionellaceae bacterium]|jgi:putative FmdB family regulatory protein